MEEEKDIRELKPLSKRHQKVLDEFLLCWRQTLAYQKAYPKTTWDSAKSAAARLFANDNFSAHLQARLDELHMSANEALKLQADIARGDMGVFFKVVDEWTFYPLPEYEILDTKEVAHEQDVDDDGKGRRTIKQTRVSYRVRYVVLDMDKVIDPRYSHLIKKFSNTRKQGVSIELYDRQEAIRDTLKIHGKIRDNLNLNVVSWKDFISGNAESDSE